MKTIEVQRIREKSYFVEAADPERLLSEFFDALGPSFTGRDSVVFGAPRHASLPLILISQLPRSGGSLLSQLLDGHPQLFAYPYEMRIGYPGKNAWPKLDPREPQARLFTKLFQPELVRFVTKGYRKPGKVKQAQSPLPFGYWPEEHYRAFVSLLNGRNATNGRDVLDCYFSAFFHAWPAGSAPYPRYVAGFVPSMAQTLTSSIHGFFADYPDGRLISIIRNPADWFVSRRAHTDKGVVRYADLDHEMANWNEMTQVALRYWREYGDRVLLLSFKDLVTDREGTMRRFAAWCGINFDAVLLRQTFTGRPIAPNTNFYDPLERLPEAVLERRSQLDENERARTLELTTAWRCRLLEAGCSP